MVLEFENIPIITNIKKNNCDISKISDHNIVINLNKEKNIKFMTFNTLHCYLKYINCDITRRDTLDKNFCEIKDLNIIKEIKIYTNLEYDFIFLQEVSHQLLKKINEEFRSSYTIYSTKRAISHLSLDKHIMMDSLFFYYNTDKNECYQRDYSIYTVTLVKSEYEFIDLIEIESDLSNQIYNKKSENCDIDETMYPDEDLSEKKIYRHLLLDIKINKINYILINVHYRNTFRNGKIGDTNTHRDEIGSLNDPVMIELIKYLNKKYNNGNLPIIIIGGDFNKKTINEFITLKEYSLDNKLLYSINNLISFYRYNLFLSNFYQKYNDKHINNKLNYIEDRLYYFNPERNNKNKYFFNSYDFNLINDLVLLIIKINNNNLDNMDLINKKKFLLEDILIILENYLILYNKYNITLSYKMIELLNKIINLLFYFIHNLETYTNLKDTIDNLILIIYNILLELQSILNLLNIKNIFNISSINIDITLNNLYIDNIFKNFINIVNYNLTDIINLINETLLSEEIIKIIEKNKLIIEPISIEDIKPSESSIIPTIEEEDDEEEQYYKPKNHKSTGKHIKKKSKPKRLTSNIYIDSLKTLDEISIYQINEIFKKFFINDYDKIENYFYILENLDEEFDIINNIFNNDKIKKELEAINDRVLSYFLENIYHQVFILEYIIFNKKFNKLFNATYTINYNFDESLETKEFNLLLIEETSQINFHFKRYRIIINTFDFIKKLLFSKVIVIQLKIINFLIEDLNTDQDDQNKYYKFIYNNNMENISMDNFYLNSIKDNIEKSFIFIQINKIMSDIYEMFLNIFGNICKIDKYAQINPTLILVLNKIIKDIINEISNCKTKLTSNISNPENYKIFIYFDKLEKLFILILNTYNLLNRLNNNDYNNIDLLKNILTNLKNIIITLLQLYFIQIEEINQHFDNIYNISILYRLILILNNYEIISSSSYIDFKYMMNKYDNFISIYNAIEDLKKKIKFEKNKLLYFINYFKIFELIKFNKDICLRLNNYYEVNIVQNLEQIKSKNKYLKYKYKYFALKNSY